MKLSITIQGREAIPVRAIPFITGWGSIRLTLSPYSLVHTLYSGKVGVGWTANHPLKGYYLLHNSQLLERRQGEWETDALNLKELQSRCEEEQCDYEQWQQQAIMKLPAKVFLWKDEFESFWYQDFVPRASMQPPTEEALLEEYENNEPPCASEREKIHNRLDFINARKQKCAHVSFAPPMLHYEHHLSAEFAKLVFAGFTHAARLTVRTRGRRPDKHIATRNEHWITQAKKYKEEYRSWSNKKIAEKIQKMKTLNPSGVSASTILEVVSRHIRK